MDVHPMPVELDSRGILEPWLLRRRVTLRRYPPGDELAGVIDRFWAVTWSLPADITHSQDVLTHPCANLSVGHRETADAAPVPVVAVLNGVSRRLSNRTLAGSGWTVAAMTTPGGLGALIPGAAADFTNRQVPLGPEMGIDQDTVVAAVLDAVDESARVQVLAVALREVLAGADQERVRIAREVAAVSKVAETDRSIRSTAGLSAACGIGIRTLQRLFREYVGVSPGWALRRYRLLDAAEAVRDGHVVVWTDVASELGYSDQAHLIRDFQAATGTTPAGYAQRYH